MILKSPWWESNLKCRDFKSHEFNRLTSWIASSRGMSRIARSEPLAVRLPLSCVTIFGVIVFPETCASSKKLQLKEHPLWPLRCGALWVVVATCEFGRRFWCGFSVRIFGGGFGRGFSNWVCGFRVRHFFSGFSREAPNRRIVHFHEYPPRIHTQNPATILDLKGWFWKEVERWSARQNLRPALGWQLWS